MTFLRIAPSFLIAVTIAFFSISIALPKIAQAKDFEKVPTDTVSTNAEGDYDEVEGSPGASASWGTSVAGIQISASTPKKIFARGEPIVLTLAIRNLGTPLSLQFEEKGANAYLFIITGPNGSLIPKEIALGVNYCGNASLSANALPDNDNCRPLHLETGKVYVGDVKITNLYDFTRSGMYTIQASRNVSVYPGNLTAGEIDEEKHKRYIADPKEGSKAHPISVVSGSLQIQVQ